MGVGVCVCVFGNACVRVCGCVRAKVRSILSELEIIAIVVEHEHDVEQSLRSHGVENCR